MWYDKYPGTPPRGSPLETLFLLVHIGRKEADMLATRALVRGQLAVMAKSTDAAKSAFDAYQLYADAMFPFLEKAANITAKSDYEQLMEHVRYPMAIDLQSVRQQRAMEARAKGLRRFAMKGGGKQ